MENTKIAAALVKAQRAFGPALKTNTNPAFRSKYADLSACVEAVVDALNANGIMLMQRTLPCEDGVCVETVFLHESGESMSSGQLSLPATKKDAQGYGSALTYARRYSLMAACGIAPEDDDGNAASKKIGVISAPKEVAAQTPLPAERMERIERIGADMVAAWDEGQELAVLNAWRSVVDNDDKVHLWAWLSSESKLRSWLKQQTKPSAERLATQG